MGTYLLTPTTQSNPNNEIYKIVDNYRKLDKCFGNC